MLNLQIKIKTANKSILFHTINIFSSFFKVLKKPYKILFLPSKKKVVTVLNSPHVNRNSQKQIYFSTHKAIFLFKVKQKTMFEKFLFLLLTNSGVFFNLKIFF
jgi:ribosomal protein S10